MSMKLPAWLSLLLSLAGALAAIWRRVRPMTAAEQAQAQAADKGAAQQRAADLEARNAEVQKAADAASGAARAVASDDGLREYEANDPDNRANAARGGADVSGPGRA